jgi:sedoheptulokinase
LPKSITIFPYFGDKVLLVAASLNGGNVLDTFVESLLNWYSQLGIQIQSELSSSITYKQQKDLIFERLIKLSENETKNNSSSQMKFKPTLFGERHDKLGYGRIENLNFANIKSVSNLFEAMCCGLIENLNEMFNCELLKKIGCERVVATGSCIMRNSIVKSHLMNVFGKSFPISFKADNDSAYGAALFCASQNF